MIWDLAIEKHRSTIDRYRLIDHRNHRFIEHRSVDSADAPMVAVVR